MYRGKKKTLQEQTTSVLQPYQRKPWQLNASMRGRFEPLVSPRIISMIISMLALVIICLLSVNFVQLRSLSSLLPLFKKVTRGLKGGERAAGLQYIDWVALIKQASQSYHQTQGRSHDMKNNQNVFSLVADASTSFPQPLVLTESPIIHWRSTLKWKGISDVIYDCNFSINGTSHEDSLGSSCRAMFAIQEYDAPIFMSLDWGFLERMKRIKGSNFVLKQAFKKSSAVLNGTVESVPLNQMTLSERQGARFQFDFDRHLMHTGTRQELSAHISILSDANTKSNYSNIEPTEKIMTTFSFVHQSSESSRSQIAIAEMRVNNYRCTLKDGSRCDALTHAIITGIERDRRFDIDSTSKKITDLDSSTSEQQLGPLLREESSLNISSLSFFPYDEVRYRPLLWMSNRGVTSPTHFDLDDNVFAMITGVKRFYLYTPESWFQLRLLPVWHPCSRQSSFMTFKPQSFSSFDVWKDQHGNRTKHESQSLHPSPWSVVDVKGGEVLFVPKYWFHRVECVTDICINISIQQLQLQLPQDDEIRDPYKLWGPKGHQARNFLMFMMDPHTSNLRHDSAKLTSLPHAYSALLKKRDDCKRIQHIKNPLTDYDSCLEEVKAQLHYFILSCVMVAYTMFPSFVHLHTRPDKPLHQSEKANGGTSWNLLAATQFVWLVYTSRYTSPYHNLFIPFSCDSNMTIFSENKGFLNYESVCPHLVHYHSITKKSKQNLDTAARQIISRFFQMLLQEKKSRNGIKNWSGLESIVSALLSEAVDLFVTATIADSANEACILLYCIGSDTHFRNT